jgi:hypothetical protein
MGGMMKRRRFWSLAGVAGLVAAVSLLVVPALGEGPVITEPGELHLEMDTGGDRFEFDPADPLSTPPPPQFLTASNCKLMDDDSLVEVVGSVVGPNGLPQTNKKPYAGLKDHRLGVGQNGEGNGEPCARINGDLNQVLTLSLTGPPQGLGIDYAELNLGFKFNGDAIIQLFRSGIQVGLDIPVHCSGASDCGPDSGGSDNKLVILSSESPDPTIPSITGVFDTIKIRSGAASAVSLEDDTMFRLVQAFDGEIGCFDDEPTDLGEGNAKLSINRGVDTDGGCKGIDEKLSYTFDSGTDPSTNELFVDFFIEPGDPADTRVAQFLEVITWEFGGPPAAPPQHRILFYNDPPLDPQPGDEDADRQPMPWCLADPRAQDVLGEPLPELPDGAVDPYVYLPSEDHTSCLIEVNSYVTPDGFTTVHTIYNIGDGKRWN